ncbi:hypothetical protein EV207_12524 [Scopulibacillus darangshiensis]|uniref:Uncharacterized protein n=1 Tax=Scopulibacillus darangshiensis TaxID=442528 RepID=A0A4R2NSL7_9BACL|nr:hypothetical protein [Scopulibacillus darangshiensis]TCP24464.1 hypothetical protein EV207_12524 [Scopulibacillus darangshiensis]
MKTCAYCCSELQEKYCPFCDMVLAEKYVMENGERLSHSISWYPEEHNIYKSTKDLLKLETIELICLLKHARAYRGQAYELRRLRHKSELKVGMNEEVESIAKASYEEYEMATRKVWVLENILRERIGYFPYRISEKYIQGYLEHIERSEKKQMVISETVFI